MPRATRTLPQAAKTAGMPSSPATGVGTLRGMRSPWPSCPLCARRGTRGETLRLLTAVPREALWGAPAAQRRTHVVATPRVDAPSVVDGHAARRSRREREPKARARLRLRAHLWHAAAPAAMKTMFTPSSGTMRCGSSRFGRSAFCAHRLSGESKARSCNGAAHRRRILGGHAADGGPVGRAAHEQPAHSGRSSRRGFSHFGGRVCLRRALLRACQRMPAHAARERDGDTQRTRNTSLYEKEH